MRRRNARRWTRTRAHDGQRCARGISPPGSPAAARGLWRRPSNRPGLAVDRRALSGRLRTPQHGRGAPWAWPSRDSGGRPRRRAQSAGAGSALRGRSGGGCAAGRAARPGDDGAHHAVRVAGGRYALDFRVGQPAARGVAERRAALRPGVRCHRVQRLRDSDRRRRQRDRPVAVRAGWPMAGLVPEGDGPCALRSFEATDGQVNNGTIVGMSFVDSAIAFDLDADGASAANATAFALNRSVYLQTCRPRRGQRDGVAARRRFRCPRRTRASTTPCRACSSRSRSTAGSCGPARTGRGRATTAGGAKSWSRPARGRPWAS